MGQVITRIAIAILWATILLGCTPQADGSRDFYSYSRTWDLYRIPILEPVELYSADKHFWEVRLPFKSLGGGPYDSTISVEEFALEDSTVFGYIKRIDFQSTRGELWIAIDLKNRREHFFTEDAAFQEYLEQRGLKEPEFWDASSVYEDFHEHGTLPHLRGSGS